MITIERLKEEDCRHLVEWNHGKDAAYLMQWAGPSVYHDPLELSQITSRLSDTDIIIFKVLLHGEMIGTLELSNINREEGTGKICRFLLREGTEGKGYGQKALQSAVNYAFDVLGLQHLILNVYTFNKGAIRCYEKVGFKIEETTEHPEDVRWQGYRMGISRFMHSL